MKNIKNCAVKLISENKEEINKWLKEIKQTFGSIYNTKVKEFYFESENIIDFRTTVYFDSKESKNEIYKKMNLIKANPIKFL